MRVILFLYDSLRLLLLIGLVVIFMTPGETFGESFAEFTGSFAANSREKAFPFLVYAAPNALFPLMYLFLWLYLSSYGSYIFLYIAGKSIAIAAALGWLIFSRTGAVPIPDRMGFLGVLACVFMLLIGDAL